MRSKFLFEKNPLLVFPELAAEIGLEEALILQQINYWQSLNEKTERNFIDGFFWVKNSYQEWQEANFFFLSERKIADTIRRLESLNLIVSEQFLKSQGNNVKFYRLNEEGIKELETVIEKKSEWRKNEKKAAVKKHAPHSSKIESSSFKNGSIIVQKLNDQYKNSETIPETITDIKSSPSKSLSYLSIEELLDGTGHEKRNRQDCKGLTEIEKERLKRCRLPEDRFNAYFEKIKNLGIKPEEREAFSVFIVQHYTTENAVEKCGPGVLFSKLPDYVKRFKGLENERRNIEAKKNEEEQRRREREEYRRQAEEEAEKREKSPIWQKINALNIPYLQKLAFWGGFLAGELTEDQILSDTG